MKYHITPLEIREIAETLHPELKKALAFKDTIFKALRSLNAKEAREFLKDTIHQLKQSKIREFKPFITTLYNCKKKLSKASLRLMKRQAK